MLRGVPEEPRAGPPLRRAVRYDEVLDAAADLTLEDDGLRRLYESYPMLSSRKLIESPHALTSFFSLF